MDRHAILLAAASLSGPGLPGQAQIEARQRRAVRRGNRLAQEKHSRRNFAPRAASSPARLLAAPRRRA